MTPAREAPASPSSTKAILHDRNSILQTIFLLRKPAGRRHSGRRLWQHALAESGGLQVGAGQAERRRHRHRRPGRAGYRHGAASENIVALCDVHDEYAARTFNRYEKAKRYKDFRKMLETEGTNIDARGDRHARPQPRRHRALRHAARQARLLREAAHPHRVGSAPVARRRQEIQGGHADGQPGIFARRHADGGGDPVVGRYRGGEGGARVDGRYLYRRRQRPERASRAAVPAALDWDLWLATAATRPYNQNEFRSGALTWISAPADRSAIGSSIAWARRTWR